MFKKIGILLLGTFIINAFMIPLTGYNQESFISYFGTISLIALVFYVCFIAGTEKDKKFMFLIGVYWLFNVVLTFGLEGLNWDSGVAVILMLWYNVPLNSLSTFFSIIAISYVPLIVSIISYFVGVKNTLNKNVQ